MQRVIKRVSQSVCSYASFPAISLFLTASLLSALLFYGCASHQETPETALPASGIQVPAGYTVEKVAGADLVDYPMFSIVDETGRLFVFESTGNVYEETEDAFEVPQFRIKLLVDEDGDGVYDKSTVFADSLRFPQGGVFYQGSLYASSAPDLLKLTDTDGDGVADEREVLLSGWILNVNANSLIGPFMAPDGWLYMTSAIEGFDVTTQEGERLKGETARIWRVRPDGSDLEWISAGGMNNPVELTFTKAGEPIGTETYFTNPRAGQRDALVYWIEGGVYPKPNNNISRDGLVRTGELMPVVSKYSRVAPSGITRYRNTSLGEDFQDNLFSVQFNTHRVLRHKLFREGASFRTEDEVFFSTDNEDFHPTDVLEDGDGSLLVVETGGWFIKGCPLSQVSKPELEGAIYRVRRQDAPPVEDAYGNGIAWTSLAPANLIEYLSDARPFVRDRATEKLVARGSQAVDALAEVLRTASSEDVRTRVTFILYRVGTPEALAQVQQALQDNSLQVRVAAARALGLARYQPAVALLIEMMQQNEPAAQRQAATALGQIGSAQTIPALLAAAEGVKDRFIEHAIIYSLVTINQPELVAQGLSASNPQVQEAALIALDQMTASPLTVQQLTPFLTSEHPDLQQTALWVASHHPEWSGDLVAFLRKRFQGPALTEEERQLFGDMLVSFCGDSRMQQFIARQMAGATTDQKLFLLDAMSGCQTDSLPEIWIRQISEQLLQKDPLVQARALELVRFRNLTSLDKPLKQVADNSQNDASIRTAAIASLLDASEVMPDAYFRYLYGQLEEGNDAPLRQQAATVLEQASLTEAQLHQLATEFLPQTDALMMARLLPAFKGGQDSKIGEALVTVLAESPTLDNFSEENLQAVFASYPETVQPEVDQLMNKLREAHAQRLARIQTLEANIKNGDIENGRALYFGKAICYTCHEIGSEGGTLGPDLTSIQKDRSAHDLLEAVVYPSVSFVREYETYLIKTKTGEHRGIIQQRTQDAIVLAIAPQTTVRLPKEEILSTEMLDVSMMPQGLDQLLSEQEMADLMAFILGQDQDPKADASILR